MSSTDFPTRPGMSERIRSAQQLLRESDLSVDAVGNAVGICDSCYFTRQFVRHVGVTPGRYRTATRRGNQ